MRGIDRSPGKRDVHLRLLTGRGPSGQPHAGREPRPQSPAPLQGQGAGGPWRPPVPGAEEEVRHGVLPLQPQPPAARGADPGPDGGYLRAELALLRARGERGEKPVPDVRRHGQAGGLFHPKHPTTVQRGPTRTSHARGHPRASR